MRTLHHYDSIGLLSPSKRTDAGYRLYDDADLERLQQILLFRELEFPLSDIREIMEAANFDRKKALEQQLELLEIKRDRLDGLVELARSLVKEIAAKREVNAKTGEDAMSEMRMMGNGSTKMAFDAFDTTKMDEYAARAKASWGKTAEYAEYEKKSAGRTREEEADKGAQLMALFEPFGKMAADGADPSCAQAIAQAKIIQDFISENFYSCSLQVFAQLGMAYGAGGEFTENINKAAGPGAAEFAAKAVAAYCAKA